jgi:hypothetical protein
MQERIDMVSAVMVDVGELIGNARSIERSQDDSSLTKNSVISQVSRLERHERGDLVTRELLPHTFDKNPFVREIAVRGLVAVNKNNRNEIVRSSALKRALFLSNDEKEGSVIKELAREFLENNQQ